MQPQRHRRSAKVPQIAAAFHGVASDSATLLQQNFPIETVNCAIRKYLSEVPDDAARRRPCIGTFLAPWVDMTFSLACLSCKHVVDAQRSERISTVRRQREQLWPIIE